MTKQKKALAYAVIMAVSCSSPWSMASAAGTGETAETANRAAAELAGGGETTVTPVANDKVADANKVEVATPQSGDGKDGSAGEKKDGKDNSVWWAKEPPTDQAPPKPQKKKIVEFDPADKDTVWWAKKPPKVTEVEEDTEKKGEENKSDKEAPVDQGDAFQSAEPPKPTIPPRDPRMVDRKITENEAAAKWGETRPPENNISNDMKNYEGKTVVDIVFEGASDKTFPTAKAALSMHIGDTFSAKALERDREAIFNTGYFYDLYPDFETVPEGIIITYHVLQNPVLQEIVITGNTVEPTEKLRALLPMRTGEILNNVALREGVDSIGKAYRDDNYVLARIVDMNIDRQGVLTLKVNEGTLEGYAVKGNTKTKDYVILREMRQKPGEPFNAALARRSVQRVQNLGFFEEVDVKMNPGVEPNAYIMEIDVKEKRTGAFGLGAGYSSQDGIVGMISLADMNFRGVGDAISITYEVSGNDTDAHGYTFSYRRPWLDKKETSATLRVYNRTYRYSDYDTEGDLKEKYMRKFSGGEITLSRPVSEYSTNFITLRNRKDTYEKHISDGNLGNRSTEAWKPWRDKNFGLTRSVTFEHVTDTHDNVYDPTNGGRVSLMGEIGGFGGDFNFRKLSIEDQRFRKVGKSQVFAMKAAYGIGSGEISEFNQFKVGGQNSLRGYRDDQFRGNRMFLATLEYRFPVASKVRGAIFTDWGSAWDDGFTPKSMKGSIGVGLSLNTPLGPLRLDYGRGSNGGRVHFSIGGSF